MIWDEFTSTLADILSTLILGHTISPNPKKRRISGKWYPGLGKVSSFKKFYLIRQLSKKQQASLEESDPPPSWTFVDASLACCCDNKKAGNPAFPQSLDPLFHQHEDGKRKSDTDIFYKFAPSIQWKDTPSKFFQMVCTAGQKLKLGQFWSLQRSPHLKIGKHEMDSVK